MDALKQPEGAPIIINDAPRNLLGNSQYAAIEVQSPSEDTDQNTRSEFLDITKERLAQIVEDICKRIEECRSDMGHSLAIPLARVNSWLWDRQIARMSYYNDFSWRLGYGETFRMNNWSQNVPRRFIRLMAAKITDDLLGTEPFFACMPEKHRGIKLTKQVEEYVQEEVGRSNLRATVFEAVRVALTEGERCIKVTHVKEQTGFIGAAVVAVDDQGKPFQLPSGDYIYPKDDFIFTVQLPDGSFKVIDPQDAAQLDAEKDPSKRTHVQKRLKKEPSFEIQLNSPIMIPSEEIDPATGQPIPTGQIRYARVEKLPQTITHRDGLDASSPFAEDFIWPIHVAHLRDADIMVHCYDEAVTTMELLYNQSGLSDTMAKNRLKITATGELSGQSQRLTQMGEETNYSKNGTPGATLEKFNCHECYYRCRVNPDDPFESWLFVVLDFATRTPIYAEYLGNLNMKAPPFRLIRGVESVPGRAYGIGVYKMMEHSNLFIDLCFNRVALKSSKECSVTFVHEDGTKETKAGLKMHLGGKEVYSIPSNSEFGKDRPPIFRVNLAELDDFAIEQMEAMVAAEQLSFGIVSMAELDASNAPIAKDGTATATRNIERSGNLLQRATENMMADDLKAVMEMAVDCVLENMDEDDMQFVEGQDQLATLNRDEIRNLDRDVRLLMTKARSEESIQINTAAAQLIVAYYTMLPSMRKRIRAQYINILKSYDVQDADDKLEEPTPEELQAEQQQNQNPPKDSMTLKIGDLVGNEVAQALAGFGIKADETARQQLTLQDQQDKANQLALLANKNQPAKPPEPPSQ